MGSRTGWTVGIGISVVAFAACGGGSSAPAGTSTTGTGGSGGGSTSSNDATTATSSSATNSASGSGFQEAAHTAFPLVPDQGGARLTHPQVVTVTFANDANAPTLESFAKWIVGSDWLKATGAEYGVKTGAVAGVAHRPETPPATMTSAQIEAYLAQGVTAGTIPRPASPYTLGDALYIVYYPATTAITTTFVNGIVKQSCTDFDAYHGEVHSMGLDFAYAVVPDCGVVLPPLDAVEFLEMVASHEFIEAATDAMPITNPAWQLRPDATSSWYAAYQFEVEVGDMCEEGSTYVHEAGFVAQPVWSNAAAAAGQNPCIPMDTPAPFFLTTSTPSNVVKAAAGTMVTYDLQGFSTAPVTDWHLQVQQQVGTLKATTKLSATTMNNGGTATLRVTIPPDAVSGTSATYALFAYHTAADATPWFLSIAVP